MKFVTFQLYQGNIIQLSEAQTNFLGWCNQHYKQLERIGDSKALDHSNSSFTVHLMKADYPAVPEIDHIDLHWKF